MDSLAHVPSICILTEVTALQGQHTLFAGSAASYKLLADQTLALEVCLRVQTRGTSKWAKVVAHREYNAQVWHCTVTHIISCNVQGEFSPAVISNAAAHARHARQHSAEVSLPPGMHQASKGRRVTCGMYACRLHQALWNSWTAL